MHKVILNHGEDWTKYIGTKVRIISGGMGALGSNDKIGYLVSSNSIVRSGSGRNMDYPRVKVKGVVWGLCHGWKIEIQKREKIYDIYGNVAITKRK